MKPPVITTDHIAALAVVGWCASVASCGYCLVRLVKWARRVGWEQ